MKMRWVMLLWCCLVMGCITPKAQENPKTADELRTVLQDFHMKMRWGLWEQASAYTTPTYRNEFLGRYEELGEDFKITNLEVKQVTLDDPVSTVDVEQEWYQEPDMVVQKKRYMETWIFSGGVWLLTERIPKEEWRERQKESPQTPEETDDSNAPAPAASDNPNAAAW